MSVTLFADQQVAVNALGRNIAAGVKRQLLVAPTGWGKGTLSSYMIHWAAANGKRTLFLVNRRTIVNDQSQRLFRLGIEHGVLMAGHRPKPWCSTHIASIDTLRRRTPPPADLIFIDEAHFAVSQSWKEVVAQYPEAVIIGMTATPIRTDGRGLGDIFTSMVQGPPIEELIKLGRLVPTRVFAPVAPELGAAKGADWTAQQLSDAMDRPKLTGDAVAHWEREGQGRPTVAFCVDRKHAEHTAEEFRGRGHQAVTVLDDTPDTERTKIFADLALGRVIVASVGVISYGFDCPPVSCLLKLRPTQSLALDMQQSGRGMRTAPGKTDCLILDHAGNTLRHGLPEEPRQWSLNGLTKRKKKRGPQEVSVAMCGKCYFAMPAAVRKCPGCGHERPVQEREIEQVAGDLSELTADKLARCLRCKWRGVMRPSLDIRRVVCPGCSCATLVPSWDRDAGPNKDAQREQFLKLEQERRERGYKPGYSKLNFHRQFGYWPPLEWIQELDVVERLEVSRA